MLRFLFGDPARDARLGEALRRAEAPLRRDDDAALRDAVMRRARVHVPARRPWWEFLSDWWAAALPAEVLVAVAAAFVLATYPASSYTRTTTDHVATTVTETATTDSLAPTERVLLSNDVAADLER